MGFLESNEGFPDFNKAVFSLWFRVSRESCDAARARSHLGMFRNNIPLLVFGVEGVANEQAIGPWTVQKTGTMHPYNGPQYTPTYADGSITWNSADALVVPDGYLTGTTAGAPYDIMQSFVGSVIYTGKTTRNAPSFIGLDCSNDPPVLRINLSTGQYGSVDQARSSYSLQTVYQARCQTTKLVDPTSPEYLANPTVPYIPIGWTWTPWDPANPGGLGDWLPPGAAPYAGIYDTGGPDDPRSIPAVITWTTERVRTADMVYLGNWTFAPVIPDVWHHILISVDLAGNGIQIAVDDVSYDADNVTSLIAYYNIAEVTIPVANYPMGVPALSAYTDNICQVQMAELQVFTGVTLDTSVEENRRAFINARGEPVDPLYGLEKAHGIFGPATPNATPSPPIKLLGKAPDISLTRKASNWSSGVNLGSAKVGFERTGRIRPVTPDPVLGK